jgi:hypothetical protein
MKFCPTCKNKYPDDANFCPREECAGAEGPQRLVPIVEEAPPRFVPISRLGGGLSGEVWQANDAQSGAAVAYKIVAAEVLPTAAAFERAQRELRQLQRTSNPRIVKIIDFGKTPEGQLFIASELASGEPLDQIVARSGPFALDRAKRIAAQIGEALLEAQKVGVIHRDLAAKNLLVSGDDEVRVINFAIPRPLMNNVFGVPEYMSPEQSEGKLIDQRSNTYSLGALIYLMLTGHPPHSGATPQATIESIQKGEITPPGIKRGAGLTPEVDRIVLKALERNSSRRPLTMRQFLTDVSALIVTDQQAAAAAVSGNVGREAGFARTMMFAGGAAEVQKLVAQAVAARQAAGNGTSEPSVEAPRAEAPRALTPPPAPPMPSPQVAPVAAVEETRSGGTPGPAGRAHGAAIAATMMALPASNSSSIPGSSLPSGTPPPVGAPAPSPSRGSASSHTPPLSAAGVPGTDAGGNFRETLWFKKGDVDQMVAEARAKVAAMASANASAKKAVPATSAEPELPVEDAKPLEDRYVDDGTVTVEDRKKFSLGSGGTATSAGSTGTRVRGGSIPGERMSENEILGEIGGGKRALIIAIAAAVVVALLAVVLVATKGKGKGKGTETTTDQEKPRAMGTSSGSPAAPEKVPPSLPPPPVAPAAKAPAATPPPAPREKPVAVTTAPAGKAEAVAKSNPPKKKVVAKKKPPPTKAPAAKKHK